VHSVASVAGIIETDEEGKELPPKGWSWVFIGER
jgi:hypothetical protein